MKNQLLLIFVTLISFNVLSQQYHSDDKAALQAFLMQDAVDGQKNYMHLGFTSEPDWSTEDWVKNVTGLLFDGGWPPQRLLSISWNITNLKGSIDLRGCSELVTFMANNNSINVLNISGLEKLTAISFSHTPIDELDLSNTNKLQVIDCRNTSLTLATLPTIKSSYTRYRYAPLREIDGGTATSNEIDLSAQNRNGNTTYKWYAESNLNSALTDITGTNGVFFIPKKYSDKTLVCHMTNSDFPDFDNDPLVYKVKIGTLGSYHSQDRAALRDFLMQESAIDGQKNYMHLGFTTEPDWNIEEWVTELKGVTWNDKLPMRISRIAWNGERNLKGSLDVRACSMLEFISCSVTEINQLNVSGLSNLQVISCVNLPIDQLDLSGLSSLIALECSKTNISQLDFTDSDKITLLDCSNTSITQLDVSNLSDLQALDCSNLSISQLNVSGLSNLQGINCSNTNLTLATLPAVNPLYQEYIYTPLNEIDGGSVSSVVDLSKLNRNGNTSYKWYAESNLTTELQDITGQNGVFNIPAGYDNQTLICYMTNSDFPDLNDNPLVYKIKKIPSNYHIDDKTALQAFLMQDAADGQKNYMHLGFTSEPNWNVEEWITQMNNIAWNDESVKRLTMIAWSSKEKLKGTLDLRKCSMLISIACNSSQINQLHVNNLENLIFIDCSETAISQIDLSGLSKLELLSCAETAISQLDLSGLSELKSLLCSSTPIKELNLSGLDKLIFINCCNSFISQLDVSELSNLKVLYVNSSNLTLATLPAMNPSCNYTYAPQREIDGGIIYSTVDLSAQNRNGNTTYKWYAEEDLSTELHNIFGTEGIFSIPENYATRTLVCHMTNSDFPDFDNYPLVYKVKFLAFDSNDKTALKNFLKQESFDGKPNYMHLGFTSEPDWETGDWVVQVDGITWSDESIKQITAINWGNKTNLKGSLDLQNCNSLKTLDCSNTSISRVNVNGLTALTDLNCSNADLTLETLPEMNSSYTSYIYTPLKEINGGTVTSSVDLSAQNRNNNTSYKWYVEGNLTTELTDISGTNGVFSIPEIYIGKTLVCLLTNTDFPDLNTNPLVYKVAVSTKYHADDKATLQAFLMQDAVDGAKNYMHLGFTSEPDWTKEDWVTEVEGLTWWTNKLPNRIGLIEWTGKTNLKGTIDLRACTYLQGFECENTSISQIEVGGMSNLLILNYSHTSVNQVDLSGLSSLQGLLCSNTPTSQLDISGLSSLKGIDCSNTNLTLATIPDANPLYQLFEYAPLNEIDGGTVSSEVDLSAQNRNGNTSYKWYEVNDLSSELTDITGTNGVFSIPDTHAGQTLVCHMTNSDFPDFDNNPLVYKVDIAESQLYHIEDKAMLKEFLMQESAIAGEKNYMHLGLAAEPNWKGEYWISQLKGVTWNGEQPMRISRIAWNGGLNLKGSLDVRACSMLEFISCSVTEINQLNVSGLSNLQIISCVNLPIDQLDLSGLSSLIALECSKTNISQLDFSDSDKIFLLDCSNTSITQLDVSNLSDLQVLDCSNTSITQLDVSNLSDLQVLDCSNLSINQLDVSGLSNLQGIYCSNTNLTLATLPAVNPLYIEYIYTPLNEIDGGTVSSEVDLSEQNRNGNSSYKWYTESNLTTELQDITGQNGVFNIPARYNNQILICHITNSDFPDLNDNPLVYKVKVSSLVSISNQPSSIDRVYTQDKQLCIDAVNSGLLQVYYTTGGLCMSKQLNEGSTRISLEKGIYVVVFNNERKILIIGQ